MLNTDNTDCGYEMNGRLNVYESIVNSIKRDIELGFIRGGDKLPSCREMALKSGVNPNTVQKAYSQLEAEGLIYTLPKKGVYVAEESSGKPDPLYGGAERALRALKEAGAKKEKLIEIIDGLYKENKDD